jgi:hypothetical protein
MLCCATKVAYPAAKGTAHATAHRAICGARDRPRARTIGTSHRSAHRCAHWCAHCHPPIFRVALIRLCGTRAEPDCSHNMLTPRNHSHTSRELIGWFRVKCPIWSGWTTTVVQPVPETVAALQMSKRHAVTMRYRTGTSCHQEAGPSHCSGGSPDDVLSRITP